MATSAYIHIPFCKSKCKYCSFISFPIIEKKDEYIEVLIKEIQNFYKGEKLKTLYFGGGTPSLLEPQLIEKIFNKFNLENNCEITLEMNPDDADLLKLKQLKDIGINRLSMGSQTFDDKILKLIGRRHTSEAIYKAVELAKKASFENISLDLIYGLPNSYSVKEDLDIITNLGIQHISTYGLKIDEGSYFYKHPPLNIPDDDIQADMYLLINKILEKKGYNRYEVSNFAIEGFESKHNLNYWNNEEYYGFGVAAHGYINGTRYSNVIDLEKYLTSPIEKNTNHIVTEKEKLEEEIFLGFRKASGITIENINKKFSINFEQKYNKILDKYMPKYITKTPSGYKLTIEGVLLSNNILADFL